MFQCIINYNFFLFFCTKKRIIFFSFFVLKTFLNVGIKIESYRIVFFFFYIHKILYNVDIVIEYTKVRKKAFYYYKIKKKKKID